MFSRESLNRLTKPRRERARSAPVEKRVAFRKKRPNGGAFSSARRFDEQGTSSLSSCSLDDTAALSSSNESRTSSSPTTKCSTRKDPLIKALVAALQKDHMLDVTLVGREGVAVRASRYVLACRCEALEDKLYTAATCTQTERQEEEIHVGEYSEISIKALVEYCFTGELLEFWKLQSSLLEQATAVERIVELSQLAQAYRFRPLEMENYQLSRRLMNQYPSTACLFYSNSQTPLDIKSFARETIEECSREALLCCTNNHVTSLPPAQLEELFTEDETLEDLSEMDKVKLLRLWSEGGGNDLQVAQRCSAAHIDLTRIHLDEQTVATLKASELFEEDDIIQAQSMACRRQEEEAEPQRQEEHVIVQGAGMEAVNGIYMRDLEQDDDEDMYVASCGTMTLYSWSGTWHIAAACDLSNSLYQCSAARSPNVPRDQRPPKVPSHGWQPVGAPAPAPRCTWMPAVIDDTEATSNGKPSSD